MKEMWRLSFLACVTVFGSALACGSESTLPEDAPPGHTVNQDGVAHAPGLNDPTQNCTACHGDDLMGGTEGQPSCYSCHGKKWP
jgi:hypothetical protein